MRAHGHAQHAVFPARARGEALEPHSIATKLGIGAPSNGQRGSRPATTDQDRAHLAFECECRGALCAVRIEPQSERKGAKSA